MAATKQKVRCGSTDISYFILGLEIRVWSFFLKNYLFILTSNFVNKFQTDIQISITGLALEKETKIYRIPTVQTSDTFSVTYIKSMIYLEYLQGFTEFPLIPE